jgi:hypothetical protein
MKQHDSMEISLDLTPAQLLGWTTAIMLFWPIVVLFFACCLTSTPSGSGAWGPQQIFLPTAICLSVLPVGAQGFLTWFQNSKLRMSTSSMIWLGSFAVVCLTTSYLVFMLLFGRVYDNPVYAALSAHSGLMVTCSACGLMGLILGSWNAKCEETRLQAEGKMQHAVEVFAVDEPRKIVGILAFLAAVIPFLVLIPTGLYASAYVSAEHLQPVPLMYQIP